MPVPRRIGQERFPGLLVGFPFWAPNREADTVRWRAVIAAVFEKAVRDWFGPSVRRPPPQYVLAGHPDAVVD